jgi:hypothetical protein
MEGRKRNRLTVRRRRMNIRREMRREGKGGPVKGVSSTRLS